MRVIIFILVLLLAGCATTTASERSGQFAADAILDVMLGIMSLATGDPFSAAAAFGSAGIGLGLSAAEGPGPGAPPAEQLSSSPDR